MAASRLTGRTLALATVALVLACGKAVLGEPQNSFRPLITRAGSAGTATRGSSVGTIGSNSGYTPRVATITAQSGGGSSVITVHGERRPTISRAGGSRQAPQRNMVAWSRPRTRQTSAEPVCVVRRIVIDDAGMAQSGAAPAPSRAQPQRRAVSPPPAVPAPKPQAHPVPAPDWAEQARANARGDPRLLAALETAAPPPALTKNAFSLGAQAISQIAP